MLELQCGLAQVEPLALLGVPSILQTASPRFLFCLGTQEHRRLLVSFVAPEHHYSENDQAPDVKLRKNTAKKERVPADDKLLPSKPSSVVDFAEEASPADMAAEA